MTQILFSRKSTCKLDNVQGSLNFISTKAKKVNPDLAAYTFKADQLVLSFCSVPPAQILQAPTNSVPTC